MATNALELGVDIGNLDAVIIHGFPPSIASLVSLRVSREFILTFNVIQRQQTGRAGRRARDSLAILVADPFGIDQYYVKHPDEVFSSVRIRQCAYSVC